MMALEELLWLYKLSLEMGLKAEKDWLKLLIEEKLNPSRPPLAPEVQASYAELKKSFEWLYESNANVQ